MRLAQGAQEQVSEPPEPGPRVLPERLAGLLVVRSKIFDVALGLGVGTGVVVLGMVVPGTFE